jgi:hypothetical protein
VERRVRLPRAVLRPLEHSLAACLPRSWHSSVSASQGSAPSAVKIGCGHAAPPPGVRGVAMRRGHADECCRKVITFHGDAHPTTRIGLLMIVGRMVLNEMPVAGWPPIGLLGGDAVPNRQADNGLRSPGGWRCGGGYMAGRLEGGVVGTPTRVAVADRLRGWRRREGES